MLVATVSVLMVSYGGYEIWKNNRRLEPPSPQLISASLENGISWLVHNRERILGVENPMLWWFVKRSADITLDKRLDALFSEYKKRHLDPYPGNVWWHLFDARSRTSIVMWQLEALPDYNLHFIYGLTCDYTLGQNEKVRRQDDPAFCGKFHLFRSSCVTHQLMGARFAQRMHCRDAHKTEQLVSALQEKIVEQLTWDPRVIDVYIQRVLMLADSGMAQKIKPVWLRRVLGAQLVDGGWGNFYPLLPISSARYVGLANRPEIREPKSDFHATAQGVFLLSLLANGQGRDLTEKK